MPPLTLNSASKAAGRSKATILDAIRSGRLSARRDDRQQWQIDPAELFRVFPPDQSATGHENRDRPPVSTIPTELLTAQVMTLQAQLELHQQTAERERRTLEGVIDDLRQDRDHWRRQASALLTHQSPTSSENRDRPPWRPPARLVVLLLVLVALVAVVLSWPPAEIGWRVVDLLDRFRAQL